MIPSRARLPVIVLSTAILFACRGSKPLHTRRRKPSCRPYLPQVPRKYDRVRDMKTWRNPYLIVRTDGVVLYDVADNAEIRLKPDELLPALARLPASNWPYGRVVAATETNSRNSDQDAVAIRRNKGIIGGMLQGAHIAVKWVPAT